MQAAPKKILLKDGGKSDLHQLTEIHRRCFPKPWKADMMLEALKHTFNKTLTAHPALDSGISGGCVGFLIYQIVAGECEIKTLAVLPEFRASGIGYKLCSEMINTCRSRNVRKLFLEVEETNVSARKLYEKLGFHTFSIRKDYYGKGRHGLIMQNKL